MNRKSISLLVAIAAVFLVAAGLAAVTNFDTVHIRAVNATGVPALKVDQQGAGKIIEFSDGGTPVFSINNGGGIVASTILTQGATLNNLIVGQPTAATTATPAALINSLAAGTNLLEVRDASTPVFTINNGGAMVSTGAGTYGGGQTVNNWAKVAAPTAIATATPAMVVDSLGVSAILEVRDAATPVFNVNNGGAVVAANGQTITAGGLTVTAGGVTITAGGLDIAAGDVAMTNGWVNIGAQTAISVTAGAVITPTGTYQVLESGAAVTCDTTTCIVDGTTEGDLLILRNDNASDTITIDGTGGNVECKTDVVLGAEDTLWLMWNGADWVCLSGYDNS